nr:MAG TPA: hypothetical protein [Caudoviricetes sp.]
MRDYLQIAYQEKPRRTVAAVAFCYNRIRIAIN